MAGTDRGSKEKVVSLIRDMSYATFTTRSPEGGVLHARPMAYRSVGEDAELWFFTKADSRKVRELKADPSTMVSFADPKEHNFVSISGTTEVVADRAKVKELWSELYRTWFPNGPDDPNIVLLRVEPEHAEYWDTPSSVVVYAYGYVKALVTGKAAKPGDVGTVDYD